MKWQLSQWMERRGSAAGPRGSEAEIECMLVAGAVVQRRGEHYWIARDFEAAEECALTHGEATSAR